MSQDRELTCKDCGTPFTFTAGEQEFYAGKGLVNAPRRCPNCRAPRAAGEARVAVAAATVAAVGTVAGPIARRARCRRLFARNAAPPRRCRLCRAAIVQSTAAIVMPRCVALHIAGAGEDL